MWNVEEVMEWIHLSLMGMLFVIVPTLYFFKRSEVRNKAKKDADVKKREEKERTARLEFFKTGATLNKIEIDKNTRE